MPSKNADQSILRLTKLLTSLYAHGHAAHVSELLQILKNNPELSRFAESLLVDFVEMGTMPSGVAKQIAANLKPAHLTIHVDLTQDRSLIELIPMCFHRALKQRVKAKFPTSSKFAEAMQMPLSSVSRLFASTQSLPRQETLNRISEVLLNDEKMAVLLDGLELEAYRRAHPEAA